jgi:hypothetical protein
VADAATPAGAVPGRSALNRAVATLSARVTGGAATGLVVVTGVLMLVSGFVHVHLWDIAYRHVATLGPLFLVQAIAALVLALLLVATRRGVFVVASLGLMAGTIVGFILVVTVGLFGFTLHEITNYAIVAVVVEGLAVVLSGATALLLLRRPS